MKKILFIILLSNLMFGQLLNNQEQELVPLKKTLNVSALKMDETNLDTIKQSPKYIIEVGIIVSFSILIFLDISLINNNLSKFAIYLVAFYKLFPTFNQFFNYYVTFKSHLKSISVIKEIMKKKKVIYKTIYFDQIKKIELKNIIFKYKNDNKFKLKNFNMNISEGDKVAIIGEAGSGKTTLLHMMMGLILPDWEIWLLMRK